MEPVIILAVIWIAVGGIVGFALGELKGRPVAGAWLGVLLGPLGWIIAGQTPRTPRAEVEHRARVDRERSKLAAEETEREEKRQVAAREREERIARGLRAVECPRCGRESWIKPDIKITVCWNCREMMTATGKPAAGHFKRWRAEHSD